MSRIPLATRAPDYAGGLTDSVGAARNIRSYMTERKVEKAKEILYDPTIQDPEAKAKAQGTLMAHAPDYLAGISKASQAADKNKRLNEKNERDIAGEGRAVAEESRKKQLHELKLPEEQRKMFSEIAPVIVENSQTMQKMDPSQRAEHLKAVGPGIIKQFPAFAEGFEAIMADGQVTDEELQNNIDQFSPFIEKNDPNYQLTTGADGSRQAVDMNNPGAAPVNTGLHEPPKKGGRLVMGPDGNVILAEGPDGIAAAGAVSPTKPTMNTIQKSVLNNTVALASLQEIKKLQDPEFMTLKGKYYGKQFNALWERAQGKGSLSAEDETFLKGYTKWQGEVERMFNSYRKEITGAAAAHTELQQLRKTFLNTDLSPSEFEATLESLEVEMKRGLRIRNRLMREGFTEVDSESYGERFDLLAGARQDDDVDERMSELTESGMPEDEVYDTILSEGYAT